jgi:hypothetical protein
MYVLIQLYIYIYIYIYRCAPVSTGNTFQDLPQLCETAENSQRYTQSDQKVSVHLMITVQKTRKNI